MEKLHLPKIEALPGLLVTAERFAGSVVLAPVIGLPLPETARIFSPDAA